MALTIDEVLRDLPKAPSSTKVASELSAEPLPTTHAGMVRKLAELVRTLPEPQLSWGSLYAVKEAGYRSPPPSFVAEAPNAEDSGPGAPLRKMAATLRDYENVRAVAFFEKNATALRAIRGLTLLRERVRP